MARLLYSCDLSLMECLRLRVKQIDFDQSQIVVRDGQGEKDRLAMLPTSLVESMLARTLTLCKPPRLHSGVTRSRQPSRHTDS